MYTEVSFLLLFYRSLRPFLTNTNNSNVSTFVQYVNISVVARDLQSGRCAKNKLQTFIYK